MTVEELKLEIEKLGAEDRATIQYHLMDLEGGFSDASEDEIEAAWIKECRRRIVEVENGTVQLVSADDVHAFARSQAAERLKTRVEALSA